VTDVRQERRPVVEDPRRPPVRERLLHFAFLVEGFPMIATITHQEPRYFAKDSPAAFERKRLALLTHLADPFTTQRLSRLGVGPGWHCLEAGAGDGSVARWLASRVGRTGRVVATDLNTRFLAGHGLPNLQVRTHDLLTDDLETGSYDLVHCRFVLMHLPEPLRALRRMVAAVQPGGWLLVEDVDVGSFGAADPAHPRAAGFDRRMQTLHAALRTTGTIDSSVGRRLPALLEGQGLRERGHDAVTFAGCGGSPLARHRWMSLQLLRGRCVAAGILAEADFDELEGALDDHSFWFVGFTSFGAWGRRPGDPPIDYSI
jgi:SAM-dependent methyltransferase